jgi:hypothetical protein
MIVSFYVRQTSVCRFNLSRSNRNDKLEFVGQQSIHSLLPTVFRSIVPAIRTTIARGVRRSASIIMKFVQPEMIEPLPRANPRSAVSTTASGVCEMRAGGR